MKIKSVAISAAVVTLCVLSNPTDVAAGIIGDLNNMFMSNSTSAGTINTKDRAGVFGGSISMRAPIMNVNIVAFDPPRIDAGCGGVDLYGGSFTFISSQQLIAILRSVAANIPGLAFKAAINAISPSLGGLLQEFQTLLQNMNNLAKNSCAMAKMIVDPFEKKIANAVSGDGSTGSALSGFFSDASGALKKFNDDTAGYFNKTGQVTPTSGNQVVKAVVASGSGSLLGMAGIPNIDGSPDNPQDPNSLNNRLLVSVLGYEIAGVNCSKQNEAGRPDTSANTANANMKTIECVGPATITLDDLVKGGGTGSARPDNPLSIYECVNPNGYGTPDGGFDPQICTSMKKSNFNYSGIKGWVNQMLFGNGDPGLGITSTSIVGKATSGSSYTLDTQQQAFLKQSGVPLIPLFTSTSNPAFRIEIARKLSNRIVDCVSASFGEALYKSANNVQNSAQYVLSDNIRDNIKNLRTDYMAKQESCLKDRALIDVITHINEGTKLMALRVQ